MNTKNTVVIAALVALIAGAGGGFVGGMKYQQSKTPSRSTFANARGQFQGRAGMGRPVTGEIIANDDKSITVKMSDGSTKIVLLSDKTIINTAVAGIKTDLKTGTKVAIFGTENADGSVSAANIQLNPIVGVLGDRTANTATKSADAREIVVTESNYAFSPKSITVKKGEKIRLVFKSDEGNHDFHIDALNVSTAVTRNGQEDFVEFTPDKTGSFDYYCAV